MTAVLRQYWDFLRKQRDSTQLKQERVRLEAKLGLYWVEEAVSYEHASEEFGVSFQHLRGPADLLRFTIKDLE